MVSLDSENQELIAVNMDHIKLSAFPTRSDPLFLKIVEVIKDLLTRASSMRAKVESNLLLRNLAANLEDSEGSSSSCALEINFRSRATNYLHSQGRGITTPVSEVLPAAFSLSQERLTARLPCRVVKPHQRNPNFVGRAELAEKIQRVLAPSSEDPKAQRSFALCGLGGVGKTQTALNYVFEHMEDFQVVLWAHADTEGKLLEDFGGFAVELGLTKQGDSDHTGRDLLKKWLETAGKTILCSKLKILLLT